MKRNFARRHYEVLAQVIANVAYHEDNAQTMHEFTLQLVHEFKRDNPDFNEDRFFGAIAKQAEERFDHQQALLAELNK